MNQNVKSGFWQRHFTTEAGFNLSWGSIFAGVVSFFAILILLTLITSAIGFGVLSPTSSDPLSGVGTGTLVWTIISLLIALFVGGFVAGLAARRTGLLHGFMTWALSLILMLALLGSAASSIVGSAGSLLGGALGLGGQAASAVGHGIASVAEPAVNSGLEAINDKLQAVNTDKLNADVKKVLKDTEVKELQPNYLSGMVDEVKNLSAENAKAVLTGKKDLNTAVDEVSADIEKKIDTLSKAADRDAIKKAVAKNTELSPAEADAAVDNVYSELKEASEQTKVALEEAKQALEETKAQIDQGIQQGREIAEDASNKVSAASVALFFALLVGMALCSFAGFVGSSKVAHLHTAQH